MSSSSGERADDPFDRDFDDDFVRSAEVKEPTARARQQAERWRKLEVAELQARRGRRRRKRVATRMRGGRSGRRIVIVVAALLALGVGYYWGTHSSSHSLFLPATGQVSGVVHGHAVES